MPLILVVEPDARHAARVASMARRQLQSEVVTADSAGRAVAALAGRVPDVLLTSPLLSRQDEATVAAWLRDLGPAAAHVQELTIPILEAAPDPAPKRRGMLSALRGDDTRSATPDGCELEMFARQIAVYLKLAPAAMKVDAAAPVMQAAVAPATAAAHIELETAAPVELAVIVAVVPEIVAAAARKASAPAVRRKRPKVVEPEVEIVPVAPPPSQTGGADDEASWVPVSFDDVCEQPLSAPEPAKVWDLARAPLPRLTPRPVAIAAHAPSISRPEPKKAISRPEPKKKSRGPAGRKPAQDEWGLFDPEQCGFAALVAKLDEVTDTSTPKQRSAVATTARLLGY